MARMVLTVAERARFEERLATTEWVRLSSWITDFCRRRIILQDAEDSMWARGVQHPEWPNHWRD